MSGGGIRPNPAENRKVVAPIHHERTSAPPAGRRPSFVDKIAGARARRRTSTPSKALAEIEKLETAGVEEVGDPVFVWPAPRGRVTGFAVGCEEHGVMPFLAPNRRAGHLAAARHIVSAHGRKGTVVLRDRPPRISTKAKPVLETLGLGS